jgi:hypothetical protein
MIMLVFIRLYRRELLNNFPFLSLLLFFLIILQISYYKHSSNFILDFRETFIYFLQIRDLSLIYLINFALSCYNCHPVLKLGR